MDRLRGPHKKGWAVFVLVIALAAMIAGGIGGRLIQNSGKITDAQRAAVEAQTAADKAQTALTALCAQRHDLDIRIQVSSALLRRYPATKVIFSIPRKLIAQANARDKNTRVNLQILDCKEPK